MFNDNFTIGEFTEGTPAARWPGYEDYEDAALWRRIEQYIVWRWGERTVEWIIQGQGLFMPPLKPVTITSIERFNDYGCPAAPPGAWMPQTLRRTPFGVSLQSPAFYRLQGTAGENVPPPDDVLEAYTRLSEYITSVKDEGYIGATSASESVGPISTVIHRQAVSLARALEYSGAADLLKAYRHV